MPILNYPKWEFLPTDPKEPIDYFRVDQFFLNFAMSTEVYVALLAKMQQVYQQNINQTDHVLLRHQSFRLVTREEHEAIVMEYHAVPYPRILNQDREPYATTTLGFINGRIVRILDELPDFYTKVSV